MSEAYQRVRGGRLAFKGGELATRDKPIDKKKKKNRNKDKLIDDPSDPSLKVVDSASAAEDIYTIDAAKKMKYEDLFPVEAKRFGYDPDAKVKSVEEALDDRTKKKADRYCK
ncbi:uncharacterized protein LOC127246111 [Andrographis paniculata]|uniref:uncharacterized protein LOC127246111 n=1 Tax=Andrographis paniculata TaxID=175694 RepID=UPI0021E6F406|nr:uncharacterized protein LOC127246111 [Andrographis paniculata]